MTNPSRAGRGQGNGGKAYRESSFWDAIEKKKKEEEKKPSQEGFLMPIIQVYNNHKAMDGIR